MSSILGYPQKKKKGKKRPEKKQRHFPFRITQKGKGSKFARQKKVRQKKDHEKNSAASILNRPKKEKHPKN